MDMSMETHGFAAGLGGLAGLAGARTLSSAAVPANPNAPTPPTATEAVEYLKKSCADLDQALQELEQHLAPIIRPEPRAETGRIARGADGTAGALTGSLYVMADWLASKASQLRELNRLVEL